MVINENGQWKGMSDIFFLECGLCDPSFPCYGLKKHPNCELKKYCEQLKLFYKERGGKALDKEKEDIKGEIRL